MKEANHRSQYDLFTRKKVYIAVHLNFTETLTDLDFCFRYYAKSVKLIIYVNCWIY